MKFTRIASLSDKHISIFRKTTSGRTVGWAAECDCGGGRFSSGKSPAEARAKHAKYCFATTTA